MLAHAVDAMESLKLVTDFYEMAWAKLVWFISGAVAFFAVLVPVGLWLLQHRQIKLAEKDLRGDINDAKASFDTSAEAAQDRIEGTEKEFDKRLGDMEARMEALVGSRIAAAVGSLYLMQTFTTPVTHITISSAVNAVANFVDGLDSDPMAEGAIRHLFKRLIEWSTQYKVLFTPSFPRKCADLRARLEARGLLAEYGKYLDKIEANLSGSDEESESE